MMTGKKQPFTLEEVARMIIHKRAPPPGASGREYRLPVKVTLPRVRFLEKPLPDWWDKDLKESPKK